MTKDEIVALTLSEVKVGLACVAVKTKEETLTKVYEVLDACANSETSLVVDWLKAADVTLWGRTAEVAAEYRRKGAPVFIEGRLELEQWETDGQKRSKLKVVGERMQMLGSGSKLQSEPDKPSTYRESVERELIDGEDSIPF